jgi:Nucleotidyl transferase AbiEii toxin, Type IV TA system
MSLGMHCAAGCAAAAVSLRVSSRWQRTSTALNALFVTRSRSSYDPTANQGDDCGQRYLALQTKARRTGRPTDELIQLYALEGFLDRLTKSQYTENFVLKGGVLLAALDARRPTRDIDFAARRLANDATLILEVTRQIAAISLDDGLSFTPKKPLARAFAKMTITVGCALRSLERIESRVPAEFSTVLDLVALFADPVITADSPLGTWNSVERRWVGGNA